MEIANEKFTKEKAKFYKDKDIAIHLKLSNGKWMNGKISEVMDASFVVIEEKLSTTLIFFGEVIKLEPREAKREAINGRE